MQNNTKVLTRAALYYDASLHYYCCASLHYYYYAQVQYLNVDAIMLNVTTVAGTVLWCWQQSFNFLYKSNIPSCGFRILYVSMAVYYSHECKVIDPEIET